MGKRNAKPIGSSFQEACNALGVLEGQLRSYVRRGMPKHKDGTFDIAACKGWQAENIREPGGVHARRKPESQLSDAAMLDPDVTGASPALERFREERAAIAKIERLKAEGKLVQTERLHNGLMQIATLLRGCGVKLGQHFGQGAQNMLNDTLDEIEGKFDGICGLDDEEFGVEYQARTAERVRVNGADMEAAPSQNDATVRGS